MTSDANPFEEFTLQYMDDPVLFVKEVLGAEPLPYQAEFLNAIATGERRISIRSGHGTGKSTSASWAMLWYLLMRFPNKVVVTAPTSGQLFDALFAELKRWIGELPKPIQDLLTVKSDRVELTAAPSEMFISARTSRAETPEALAGVHSDNVLLVVDEMRERYGEESNAFRIRVLGEFPLADDDTIIPFHLVDAAMNRDIEVDDERRPVWAVDPARFGSDRTAFCKRVGSVITEIKSWRGLDLMQTVGRVMAEYEALNPSNRPSEILVDSIGVGSGVVDRLRELGAPVRGVNVAESPSMGETYNNLRTELWFKTKAWLEDRGCKLPQDDELMADLTGIRYSFTSSGKMAAESKDQMRRRGLRSPDLADAVCLTMASDAAMALSGPMSTWRGELRRNLRGIA